MAFLAMKRTTLALPRYTYEDMITAQYRLVTEGLHIDHLRLILGTSMGGMHAWMWGEKYPGFMDGLVPLASVPDASAISLPASTPSRYAPGSRWRRPH